MAVTGWSALYNDAPGSTPAGYSLLDGKMPRRYAIKRVVNREGFRTFTALFNGLVGAATGSNVTATHKRRNAGVPQAGPHGGGAITIDTITDINRNTAAADVTALKEMTYNVKTRPSPYVRDLSGNGGPAYS